MRRRTFLAGVAGASLGGVAGCVGGPFGSGGSDGGASRTPLPEDVDGYPNSTNEAPQERSVDTGTFSQIDVEGTQVPLAPVDVTHYWHQRREARFADARGRTSYERSHVEGAVLSPAPDGGNDDPAGNWPKDDRIVCYCGCPHHLSSLRAATLIEKGYESVYVIDEGFWEWTDRGYPVAGNRTRGRPQVRVVRGSVPARYAGETVWARHEPTGQREAGPVAADGGYELELSFADVTEESVISVETPAYTVSGTLGELINNPIKV